MKILITTDVYKPLVNGVVTSTVNLIEELTKLGHDIKVLTLSSDTSSYKVDNVYYIKSMPARVYPELRYTVYYKSRLLNEIIEWEPDLIHSQTETSSFIFAEKIAEKLDIPIVHTYHTLYEDYGKYLMKNQTLCRKLIAILSKHILKDVDMVIAPTVKVEKTLRRYRMRNDVKVIPTGIDVEKFNVKLSEEEKIELKQRWNIPLENKILISVGRVAYEKSLDVVVSHFAEVLKQTDKITLMIVGDGPAKESLEDLAEELNITENVVFTGMIDPDMVQKYYQMGDIFTSASTSETQGLTYIEAMANGLPLLCQKDDCLEGVLFPNENGFYFQSSEEFVEGVMTYIDNKDLFVRAKEFNLKLINTFSKEQFALNVQKEYQRVVEEKAHEVDFSLVDIFARN